MDTEPRVKMHPGRGARSRFAVYTRETKTLPIAKSMQIFYIA